MNDVRYIKGYSDAMAFVTQKLGEEIATHDTTASHCRSQGRFEDARVEEEKARAIRKLLGKLSTEATS